MTGLLYTLAAFVLMEGVAWFAHKYIMHGLLWSLHEDHHVKDHSSFWERNDFFFALFATPGIYLIWRGTMVGDVAFAYFGAGIALYGFTYFVVHDIFIHQRFKILRNSNHAYLRALRKAHKVHHKHLGKHQGECFGMLLVPIKYYREAKRGLKA